MDTLRTARAGNDQAHDEPKSSESSDASSHHESNPDRAHQKGHDVKKANRHPLHVDEEEPLVDTTAAIPLRSKRTERLQKRQQKRSKKNAAHSDITSFLELPSELLLEVLSFLRPSDVFILMRINRSTRDYVEQNEQIISESINNWRYPILAKCFPLPVLFNEVDKSAHSALLSLRHQQRLLIHKLPYQHVKSADPQKTCSCMSCVMAWNNLCLPVDLAHWQLNLDRREPIPMIARGTRPQWNSDLVEANAHIVEKAIRHPLWYARILQTHLSTTVRTIVRHAAVRRKNRSPVRDVPASKRLFHLSKEDIASERDSFMQRSGPPSFEFPFTRDNYYTLVSYLPNRRWDEGGWIYYGDLHERDVAWAKMVAERQSLQTQASLVSPQEARQTQALQVDPTTTTFQEVQKSDSNIQGAVDALNGKTQSQE